MKNFQNLYEVTKTVRFELKPSKITFKKLENNKLFKTKHFESKIFSKNEGGEISKAEKKEKNYIFEIDEVELNNLVEKCDKKIEEVNNIKIFLGNNLDDLWKIWIDNEKIKIIDKDLKYILQEKKTWKKSFWNEITEKQSNFIVEWKKGSFLTLDDVDAYYEKTRSVESSERKAGKFTEKVIERLDFLLKQYRIRKIQLLLNTKGDTGQNEKKLFQTKKERVTRIRSLLGIFLKLERICSLFNYKYEDSFCKFPSELKENLEKYNSELGDIISEIETIFEESNLYLHKNIERKFSLNIRSLNPRPENIEKNNQVMTEDEILEAIEFLEEEISKAKRLKAKIKGERSVEKNNGNNNWKKYKELEWNYVLKKLNPSNKAGLFSKLTELRRDLEEVHLTHFAVLLEKDGLFYLVLENKRISNQKNGDIKKMGNFELKNFFENKDSGNSKFLSYKTITFKALRRLCLEEFSSMKTEYFLDKKNITWTEWNSKIKNQSLKNWREEKYFNDLKIYLQKILRNKAGEIGVKFTEDDFQEWGGVEWDKDLKGLSDLINKQGYKSTWNSFRWEELLKLENKSEIEIFQIYNKDFLIDPDFAIFPKDKEKVERIEFTKEKLKKEGKEFVPKYKNSNKKEKQNLYTIYWQDFFSDIDNEKFRIKPEGKFYIRLAGENRGSKNISSDFSVRRKARFTENKILADFNLWINPTIDKVSASARKKEEVKQHIEAVNKLHQKDSTDFYLLGMDRGLNSLISYALFDSNLNIAQQDKDGKFYETQNQEYNKDLKFVCGDWSLVNSKGEFVKRKDCKFLDRKDLKDFTHVVFPDLKKYYEFEKDDNFSINDYVGQFIEDSFQNHYIEYGNKINRIRLYVLNEKNIDGKNFEIREVKNEVIKNEDGRPLLDGNDQKQYREIEKEIFIVDKTGNKVSDYVLSFYIERAKRLFAIKKQQDFDKNLEYSKEEIEELLFESVDELKEGFTDFVVGEIVKLSKNIEQQTGKKLYIVLEDLSNYGNSPEASFTEKEHKTNLSVLIYQKLENNLVKKFNYFQTKEDSELNKAQLSPKIQRIEDIKEFQKKNKSGGQLGNLIFVDPENTSKQCPSCKHSERDNRKKKNPLLDIIDCQKCGFSTKENGDKKGFDFINGGDILAAYNIAKRGLEFIENNI